MNWFKALWGLLLSGSLIGIIFAIPFLPLSSDRAVNVPFLESTGAKDAIVFFGFTGCHDVCPTTLATLGTLVDDLPASSIKPLVAFIDIDSLSNTERADRYVKQFHADFIGLHLDNDLLNSLSVAFGLNFSQHGEEIAHQGRTYLLKRRDSQWHLVRSYNPGTFDAKSFEIGSSA